MRPLGGNQDLPKDLPQSYYRGFQGCIEFVQIDAKRLHLVNDRKNTDPVSFCDSAV